MQYGGTLPLEDHEVVLTFDDGPLPPYTTRILDILAENCVKVDYFLVGEMASNFPDVVRRIYNSGHVIGTHSLHHPLTFNRMDDAQLEKEVEGGIAAVDEAVGDPRAVAPFFRIPGLLRSNTADSYLAEKSLAVFSADEVADDWRRGITPKRIVALAMKRLEKKGHRGVLLLHDIHPATVIALPKLLQAGSEPCPWRSARRRGPQSDRAAGPGAGRTGRSPTRRLESRPCGTDRARRARCPTRCRPRAICRSRSRPRLAGAGLPHRSARLLRQHRRVSLLISRFRRGRC
jgi:peptidoglycan/xylan/chitin deacetylase (PgdA/CDA1 family)